VALAHDPPRKKAEVNPKQHKTIQRIPQCTSTWTSKHMNSRFRLSYDLEILLTNLSYSMVWSQGKYRIKILRNMSSHNLRSKRLQIMLCGMLSMISLDRRLQPSGKMVRRLKCIIYGRIDPLALQELQV
jgi:hypothetical protein